MTDILDYMVPSSAFSLYNHLGSSVAGVNPVYVVLQPGKLWFIKGSLGWPWDIDYFDSQYVYQNVTENSWTDPKAYKAFSSKSWVGGHGGIVWAPRYVNEGVWNPPIVTSDSSYAAYSGCQKGAVQNIGPVSTQVNGPFEVNFDGDVGYQTCMIQSYCWGQTMEVNYYARGFGHVLWQLYDLVNGVYTFKQESRFNLIKQGGSPVPVFPCTLP